MKQQSVFAAVTNDISTDYRVHKICSYLTKRDFDVSVYGRVLPDTFDVKRNYKIIRKSHFFNHNFLFYAEYNIRLFFFLLWNKYHYILSNDLDTLPACFLASKIRNSKLVYDSHELFTEVPELEGRQFVKSFWRTIESFLLPKLKLCYTVSESISNYYHNLYGIKMGVVRNIPLLNEDAERTEVEFPTQNKVILYQGVLNPGRGIKEMVNALHYLDAIDLVIIGYGKVEQELKSFVKEQHLTKRVHFMGRVPREELSNYSRKADIGMVLERPMGLSFQFSLPNKLFDFIHAEVPIISSDLVEVQKIVEEHKIGIIVNDLNPEKLAGKITELLSDKTLRKDIIENQKKAKHILCWEKESEKLDLYFK